MNNRKSLAKLSQIASIKFDAEKAKMATILEREIALRDGLRRLDDSRRVHILKLPQIGDPAALAGADLQWYQWIDQRRAILNTELAQVLALKDAHQKSLRGAFGRDQAINGLQMRTATLEALARARRAR